MKKILIFASLFLGGVVLAQENGGCATDHKLKEIQENEPEVYQQYLQNQRELEEFREQYAANTDRQERVEPYVIPVVFHVLHEGDESNISNEQIYDCLRVMNEDFQKRSTAVGTVKAEFAGIAADMEFEFRLAQKKPNGDCFSGITRTFTSTTNDGSEVSMVNAVSSQHGVFDGDEYLNIFVVKNLGGGSGGGYVAGYTYRPGTRGTSMRNGIYIVNFHVGTIGTAIGNDGRSMSHEAGHWLDLPHPWGGTNNPEEAANCNDDDGIADTPNTIGWFGGCNLNGTTCGSLDNVENIMDYSSCPKMFTEGQKTRAIAAINGWTDNRRNVISSGNLAATGVLDDIMCAADFEVDYTEICAGQSVSFTDLSYHAPTSWSWSFPGAVTTTSSAQNPTVRYNTPGTYSVTLTVSNANGTVNETKTSLITVLPNAISSSAVEDFESLNTTSDMTWTIINGGDDSKNFRLYNSGGANGSQKSFYINNYGNTSEEIEALISPPIDLSGVSAAEVRFDFAHRCRTSSDREDLKIYVSNDCGQSWIYIGAEYLVPGLSGVLSTGFTPAESDWKESIKAISNSYYTQDIRIKIEFKNGSGNNFYIDNIFIGDPSTLGVEDMTLSNFNLYPNPASHSATLSFNALESGSAVVEVINLNGQTVTTPFVGDLQSGNQEVTIAVNELPAGVYFVSLTLNGVRSTQRLVVE